MCSIPKNFQPQWLSAAGVFSFYCSESTVFGNNVKASSLSTRVGIYVLRIFIAVSALAVIIPLDGLRCVIKTGSVLLGTIFIIILRLTNLVRLCCCGDDSEFPENFKVLNAYKCLIIDTISTLAVPLLAIAYAFKGKFAPSDRIEGRRTLFSNADGVLSAALFQSFFITEDDFEYKYEAKAAGALKSALRSKSFYLFKRIISTVPLKAISDQINEEPFWYSVFFYALLKCPEDNRFLEKLLKIGYRPNPHRLFTVLELACVTGNKQTKSYEALKLLKKYKLLPKTIQLARKEFPITWDDLNPPYISIAEYFMARGVVNFLSEVVLEGARIDRLQWNQFRKMVAEIIEKKLASFDAAQSYYQRKRKEVPDTTISSGNDLQPFPGSENSVMLQDKNIYFCSLQYTWKINPDQRQPETFCDYLARQVQPQFEPIDRIIGEIRAMYLPKLNIGANALPPDLKALVADYIVY